MLPELLLSGRWAGVQEPGGRNGDVPVELLHLQLFKKLAGAQVAVVSKIPSRMQKAESMGADAVFEHRDSDVSRTVLDVMDFTREAGAGFVVISMSNPAAFEFATRISGKNSKINVFAGMPGGQAFSLDSNRLHYNQIYIMGTFSSTPAMLQAAAGIAAENAMLATER